MSRGWWRENRWWLLAMPVAVAALLGASAYNLHDYWYIQGLHHEAASASQGEFVKVTDDYDDTAGHTSRTFRVRLDGIEKTARYPFDDFEDPAPVSKDQEALVVHLDWEADPDQALTLCSVALKDDEGRRYEIVGNTQHGPCTPEGHDGPDPALFEGQVRGDVDEGEERPPTWSTAPIFLVPAGVTITQVLLWWDLPDYVSLTVS